MRTEKEIGLCVRQLRGSMSLRDFAKKCGISHTTIDNLEKGIDFRTGKPTQVKITTLQKIAEACGVPLSYIVGEDPSPNAESIKPNHIIIRGRQGELIESELSDKQIELIMFIINQQKKQ